ncbi:MAG TPA: DUF3995 domain-containing protein [Blastocatellia bacterium]|nr:DUF3995 domain-containing protein [Blastocatellia bacterium]
MIYGAGILAAAIFAALSVLHIYWALGGRWGSGAAIPAIDDKRAFNPSPGATLAVAAALLVAMLTIIGRLGLWGTSLPKWIFSLGTWGITLVFLLRAVGDFRLVGFFKRVRGTDFACWDTRLFSPLCLLISILALIVTFK